jgi:hypothetical protein
MPDAILTAPAPAQLQVVYGGESFKATDNAAVVGALLFALEPRSVHFESDSVEGSLQLEASLQVAIYTALILHAHATRLNRSQANLPVSISIEQAQRWVSGALKLCPADSLEAVDQLMALRLGPQPWGDGLH